MRSTFAVLLTLGLVACGGANPDPAAREMPAAETTTRKKVSVYPEEVSDNRLRFVGEVTGASEPSFLLRLRGVNPGNEFDREVTVAIAPDGTFESEVFDLSGGAEDGVYTATFSLPLPSGSSPHYNIATSIESQIGKMEYLNHDERILPEYFASSEDFWPEDRDTSVEGRLFLEITIGLLGEAGQPTPSHDAWREQQTQFYQQWYANLEALYARATEQYKSGATSSDAFCEAFRADLASYRGRAVELDFSLTRNEITQTIDALGEVCATPEDASASEADDFETRYLDAKRQYDSRIQSHFEPYIPEGERRD